MKKLFTLALCVIQLAALAQETEQDVASTIQQVTVFLQGAQVMRQAHVSVKPGVSILTLKGVSPRVTEQSIQVEGSAALKLQSVSFRVNYLSPVKQSEKISALEAERKRLHELVVQERSMLEVYTEEEVILKTNKNIGGTNGIEVNQLKTAMEYFRQRLADIKQQQLSITRTIAKYEESQQRIDAQLKELNGKRADPSGEITIKVTSKTSTQADLKIKYLVDDARWYPSYDIRAKNIQSPVAITYKANVSQQSGEDWDNVELTISSANPSQLGARPVIKPWYLGFNNNLSSIYGSRAPGTLAGRVSGVRIGNAVQGRIVDDAGDPVPGVSVIIKGTTVGTSTDVNGEYSIALTGDAQTLVYSFIGYKTIERNINQSDMDIRLEADQSALQEVVVTGYADSGDDIRIRGMSSQSYERKQKVIAATPVVRQTNIEFTIDEPFSIKSDGEMRTTDMVEYELDALYQYYCVPKLETDAFLLAKVLRWDEYNFLDGEANLFFEGKYIGKSIMDTRNTTDTLTLSLGRDANVLVTREKVKDLSSRQFVGSNQKATFGYDIVVRNKKALPLTIIIEDQLPVPNTKEISVDRLDDSKGDYNENSGIIRWQKNIAPGKSEAINLKYAVRYPKHSHIMLE
jgi:hypothetical protein